MLDHGAPRRLSLGDPSPITDQYLGIVCNFSPFRYLIDILLFYKAIAYGAIFWLIYKNQENPESLRMIFIVSLAGIIIIFLLLVINWCRTRDRSVLTILYYVNLLVYAGHLF